MCTTSELFFSRSSLPTITIRAFASLRSTQFYLLKNPPAVRGAGDGVAPSRCEFPEEGCVTSPAASAVPRRVLDKC